VRTECLDWLLILNRTHLERVLRVYVRWPAGPRPGCTAATPLAVRSHPAPDRPWTLPAGEETTARLRAGPRRVGERFWGTPGGKVLRISPSAGGNLLGNHIPRAG
jgi:hypothetical protein